MIYKLLRVQHPLLHCTSSGFPFVLYLAEIGVGLQSGDLLPAGLSGRRVS